MKIASADTTEMMGYTLAMDLLSNFLEATYQFWSTYKEEYNIFVMGDAQSSFLALGSHPKTIISRSTRHKVIDQARKMVARFPKIVINFGYIRSAELPADLNSKIHLNIVEKSNSSLWRYGPSSFTQEQELLNQTYIKYNPEAKTLEFVKKLTHSQTANPSGPENSQQIIETLCRQSLATDVGTEQVEELGNQSADRNWLSLQKRSTQLTALSQASLAAHNLGICNLVHTEGLDCSISGSKIIELKVNNELYRTISTGTKSLGHLMARIVHQIILPLLILRKVREKQSGQEVTEYTVASKIQEGWRWLLIQSQGVYPPPKMRNYSIKMITGV